MPATKKEMVWFDDDWKVVTGRLPPRLGRPRRATPLFKFVAEKLPFACLKSVEKKLKQTSKDTQGVYLVHDSMGVARYGGRGQIFSRLAEHKRTYSKELLYFSFYVIATKIHEREIETAILRAAGPGMTINIRKVPKGIEPGSVNDYEPGTKYFERQRPRGRPKKKVSRARKPISK